MSEEAALANTRTILTQAQARWPTLMVGPPCTGDGALDHRVRRVCSRMELLCRTIAVPFLPIFTLLESSEVWHREAEQGDGVHPNAGGYTHIYQAVLAWQPWRDWLS